MYDVEHNTLTSRPESYPPERPSSDTSGSEERQSEDPETLELRPGNWPMGVILLVMFATPLAYAALQQGSVPAALATPVVVVGFGSVTTWLYFQRLVLTLSERELHLEEGSFGPWRRRSILLDLPSRVEVGMRRWPGDSSSWEWYARAAEGEISGVRTEKAKVRRDLERVSAFLSHAGIEVFESYDEGPRLGHRTGL